TYITPDTEALSSRTERASIEALKQFAMDATRFDDVDVPDDERRQLEILKLSFELVTPSDPEQAEEVTRLKSGLEATYGRGRWCPDPQRAEGCLDIGRITEILATSRDEPRSEERRVGKECRSRWTPAKQEKKIESQQEQFL